MLLIPHDLIPDDQKDITETHVKKWFPHYGHFATNEVARYMIDQLGVVPEWSKEDGKRFVGILKKLHSQLKEVGEQYFSDLVVKRFKRNGFRDRSQKILP